MPSRSDDRTMGRMTTIDIVSMIGLIVLVVLAVSAFVGLVKSY